MNKRKRRLYTGKESEHIAAQVTQNRRSVDKHSPVKQRVAFTYIETDIRLLIWMPSHSTALSVHLL